MPRREFIAGLGSTAVWPLSARAQQPALPVIGVLLTLGGESSRSAAGARSRSRPPPRSRDRSPQHDRSPGGEGSDHDHAYRLWRRR
jgi:hypothetical protein